MDSQQDKTKSLGWIQQRVRALSRGVRASASDKVMGMACVGAPQTRCIPLPPPHNHKKCARIELLQNRNLRMSGDGLLYWNTFQSQ